MTNSWETKAEICRKILTDSLNQEWLLPQAQLPPQSTTNIMTFPDTCGKLTDRETAITKLTAEGLTKRMGTGEMTATEVVIAFLKRGHIVHQLCNFATEFLVKEALEQAAKLDKHFEATGKLVGPLHGVPISVKEHFGFKGKVCHSAYVCFIDHIPSEDALILRILRDAGAVLHVRTNEPQILMSGETDNPIYGVSVNPFNRNLTPGGSSGGEGIAVGTHCSVIGLGTDIGGSVRVPAAFCGAYGLRTTALRNPYKGIFFQPDGQESIRCIAGPLANSLEDIDLFESVVLGSEPWDEEISLVPLPWKNVAPPNVNDLTVGVIWEDGTCRLHPPMLRALRTAVSKLQNAGVKVVDFEPFEHSMIVDVAKKLFFADAGQSQKEMLADGGEPIVALTQFAFDFAVREPMTVRDNWALNDKREGYRATYHRLMKERGVDVILSAAYPGPPAELGTFHYWAYTTVWNLLDQPAITFPTGLSVDQDLDKPFENFTPRSDVEKKEFYKCQIHPFSVTQPDGLISIIQTLLRDSPKLHSLSS
ncbi:putative amidase [Fonsecaea pedrosoi]|nr:putative amidase [Fonsecaea pedrosoi]